MNKFSTKMGANQKAMADFLKSVFVPVIILSVVVYSEVLFLGIISSIFPDGVMRIGAMVGAVATGASVLALYMGKSHWFAPGSQLLAAWIFTGIEVVILILNDILAYQMHTGSVDQFFLYWKEVCPAAPVVALICWGVILFLDVEQEERSANLEMNRDKMAAEREYALEVHRNQMELQGSYLTHTVDYMKQYMDSEPVQARLQEGAKRMVEKTITELSGLPMHVSQFPNERTVDATRSLAQEAQVKIPVDVKKKAPPVGNPPISNTQ